MIRFQNTGNTEAINIHIIDSISNNLDITTSRVIGSSHPMYTEVLQTNVLKFNFDSIILPDSSSNQIKSSGYVIFEIYPQSGVSNGTIVENKSEIYFDFNPPVITNSVMNTLIDVIPPCSGTVGIEHQYFNNISIFPNPTKNKLNIVTKHQVKQIEIINIMGTRLMNYKNSNSINVSELEPGIYFINIETTSGTFTNKFVKK
jgi:hypothetical protein|tara:strand:- start:26958 stop:27563 length:606 start_codon:yes stop_codon:yes gene_type:complete